MQVENAVEGINQAGSSIGVLTEDGIAFACERDVSSSLLETSTSGDGTTFMLF
jgi:20S proteasome subunit alpha 3